MPAIPIIMPQLGESIAEAAIISFLVQPGDRVEAGQDLIEVETNKATMTVTAPCGGSLKVFSAQLNESRSEEHTSELHTPMYLGCRLLLENKQSLAVGFGPVPELRRAQVATPVTDGH